MGRWWFCVSTAERARASSSQRCIRACTGVHSDMPGKGLPSRRESVSRVVHHALHARRLLGHHAQVPGTLFCVQRQGLQGFDKAGEHRERRADLVRDIGHEITAHGVGLLQGRDIAGQQQLAPVAIRMQVHRNAHRPRWRAVPPRQHHLAGEILRGVVGAEVGVAHQVANGLHDIALGIEPELRPQSGCTTRCGPSASSKTTPLGVACSAARISCRR
jgi:hypothetical protein